MTPTTKATKRVSSDRWRGRNIIVIVGPGNLIGFRLKGTRKTYETTAYNCMEMAARAQANHERIEKLKAKGKYNPRTYKPLV